MTSITMLPFFFFFNDTATTEIYTLSLHDALPIFAAAREQIAKANMGLADTSGPAGRDAHAPRACAAPHHPMPGIVGMRSEEHTSELQSQSNLVCRLLLEKKKQIAKTGVLVLICPY